MNDAYGHKEYLTTWFLAMADILYYYYMNCKAFIEWTLLVSVIDIVALQVMLVGLKDHSGDSW